MLKSLNIKRLFSSLDGYQKAEYMTLLLWAVAIPLSWKLALKALALFALATIIRFCHEKIRKTYSRPAHHSRLNTIAYLLSIGFFAIYLISIAYSSNTTEAWSNVNKKMAFAIAPVLFLVSNPYYLTRDHIRLVLHLFSATLIVRFLFFLIRALNCLITRGAFPLDEFFDPLHHTYLALYTLLALAFLYTELVDYARGSRRALLAVLGMMVLLVAYIIITQSRTGLVGLILLIGGILIHLVFVQKRIWLGIITIAAIIIGAGGVYILQPDTSHRLTNTIKGLAQGNSSDDRLVITQTALQTIGENLPWGVGVGDRIDELQVRFKQNTSDQAIIDRHFNPHNQFLDTLLSTGVIGLLVLLSLVAIPFFVEKRDNVYLLLFISITAFCALFESILERQMGIQFFCLFYCLLLVDTKEGTPID